MFDPDRQFDLYGGKMISLATSGAVLNVSWIGGKLKIFDVTNSAVLYEGIPADGIHEILDVNIENAAAEAAADVTVLLVKKTETTTGHYGNRSLKTVISFDVNRVVFADLVTLPAAPVAP